MVADAHSPDDALDIRIVIESLRKVAGQGVDAVIDTGDAGAELFLHELRGAFAPAPVYSVRGNHDDKDRPARLDLNLAGWRTAVIHGDTNNLRERVSRWINKRLSQWLGGRFRFFGPYYWDLRRRCREADLVPYGHTHEAAVVQSGRTIFINAGTASLSGGGSRLGRPTVGLLELNSYLLHAQIVALPVGRSALEPLEVIQEAFCLHPGLPRPALRTRLASHPVLTGA
jgi:predicted phosphodiesterase